MTKHTIAVIGGTGPQGRGLAYRFALAGHQVTIGSRAAERAQEKAAEIGEKAGVEVAGAKNADAAQGADVVLVAVPWDGHNEMIAELAPQLAGKVVISCVNPLGFDKGGPYGLSLPQSAAEDLQEIVPEARVVGAFHHVAAASLWESSEPMSHEDVLVCGNDVEAKELVLDLAAAVTGHRGVNAGKLRLARQLEPLTAVLISINKAYKTRSGVAISGINER